MEAARATCQCTVVRVRYVLCRAGWSRELGQTPRDTEEQAEYTDTPATRAAALICPLLSDITVSQFYIQIIVMIPLQLVQYINQ